MKKISQHLDDELLLYLDGQLDSATKRKVELAFSKMKHSSSGLLSYRLWTHTSKGNVLEAPSKNFTQLVMSRLDQYPAQSNGFLFVQWHPIDGWNSFNDRYCDCPCVFRSL